MKTKKITGALLFLLLMLLGGVLLPPILGGPDSAAQEATLPVYTDALAAGTWQEIEIPLSELGWPGTVSAITWQTHTSGTHPPFYLDDITFVGTGVPTSPALSVDAAAQRHAISPYIYGMNFAGEELANEVRLPAHRRGGNSTVRYNWQIDVRNAGSDWYFENIPNANAYGASLPHGSSADLFVEQNNRTGTETIMTMPLIGWTPKPGAHHHPYDCGFNKYTYNYTPVTDPDRPGMDPFDPYDPPCGNGFVEGPGGAAIHVTGNDPLDTSIQITTTFVTDWIDHLTTKYGTAANGGVMFYNLDNEPMLWNGTHRDVHPQPVDYTEIRDRTYQYGAAIKAADPTAQTLGPVVWGWCAYFYSAADGCGPGDDHAAYGDFIPWYLQQMAAYEAANGARILDHLDLHYYPQANGVTLATAGNEQTQALRLRSTRSLWDPTYVDESWIAQPVNLIPRMKAWVNTHYPGVKLAISEYNWGGLEHINGALAQADVLGIFGREALDLATLWSPPGINEPGAFAFRMYRNYDGAGSGFGETSVHAASTDQEKLAIYAAQRNNDKALTLMIINKTGNALTSTVSLTNFQPIATAQVYRYSSANLAAIIHEPNQPVNSDGITSGFTAGFTANSITLIIIPQGNVYLPVVLK